MQSSRGQLYSPHSVGEDFPHRVRLNLSTRLLSLRCLLRTSPQSPPQPSRGSLHSGWLSVSSPPGTPAPHKSCGICPQVTQTDPFVFILLSLLPHPFRDTIYLSTPPKLLLTHTDIYHLKSPQLSRGPCRTHLFPHSSVNMVLCDSENWASNAAPLLSNTVSSGVPVLPSVIFQPLMLMGTSARANQVSPTTCMSQGPVSCTLPRVTQSLSQGGVGSHSASVSLLLQRLD